MGIGARSFPSNKGTLVLLASSVTGKSGRCQIVKVSYVILPLERVWRGASIAARPDHIQLDSPLVIGYHIDIYFYGASTMPTRSPANQIAFRYRSIDSATGVTRETAKKLAQRLGVDETQAIHRALHELAVKLLPQYEADDGPLTAAQLRQIRQRVPQGGKRSVRSNLFATKTA